MKTRFRCAVCGKLTSGRMPRAPWHPGDGTERFPRKHYGSNGKPCPGNVLHAEWVEGEKVFQNREVER